MRGCLTANGAHKVTTADVGLHKNSDLQMFVRVTVRGRPTTNGAHEVTTADELQPWDFTRTLTSKVL